jgi:hypothetical protein
MNLSTFLNRGAAHAPKPPKYTAAELRGIKRMRENWLRTITADQVRCWMDLGEKQAEIIGGMSAIFGFGYYVAAHDHGEQSLPARVIRGGMSAAAGAVDAGYNVTKQDAMAFDSACDRVRGVIEASTDNAIVYAARKLQEAAKGLM